MRVEFRNRSFDKLTTGCALHSRYNNRFHFAPYGREMEAVVMWCSDVHDSTSSLWRPLLYLGKASAIFVQLVAESTKM